jgi:23S rRNA pseudouridine2605 synthase
LTAEQLEASRIERMRLNGHGTLTFEEARTWIEETGLCLFLPRRQFSTSVAPSFVEAVAGHRDSNPDPKHITLAEELLVRLEIDGVAVRLNLLGQPGDHPDFIVATWVLPYVYALRGDRDWRRSPQLTGSRQVSPLAVQAYKLLEGNETTIPALKHTLGREVSEQAVLRAITELWQQLRIIPVIAAPGQTPKWQLLRVRYQKAIAEGASTSQVTAISVLASIFLQAVIAATMEDVELFLAPLTARSKVREVIRGLVATRQVHSISLGHAPHFYVAGTLPEFSIAQTMYASSSMPASPFFLHSHEEDSSDRWGRPPSSPVIHHVVHHAIKPIVIPPASTAPAAATPAPPTEPSVAKPVENQIQRHTVPHKPVVPQKTAARPHFSRPAAHSRDRKPAQSANRSARRPSGESRSSSRPASGSRNGSSARSAGARWQSNGTRSANGRPAHSASNGNHANGTRNGKPAAARNGHAGKPATKTGASRNGGSLIRKSSSPRKDVRTSERSSRIARKPALSAGAKAGNSKRYGFTAPRQRTKKRG